MRITETVKLSRGLVECSSNQVRTEDMVLTVGIEFPAFKQAKIKNKPTSQQKSQQQRGDKKSAPLLLFFSC
jgi:hypothetical protein